MSEIAGIFKGLFDKIGGFFHIFDASYFIAGFVGFFTSSIIYFFLIPEPKFHEAIVQMAINYKISTVIIVCLLIYIIGFILFNIGRVIRMHFIENLPIYGGTFTFTAYVDYEILNAISNYRLEEQFKEFGKKDFNEKLIKDYTYKPKEFNSLYKDEQTNSQDQALICYVKDNRILYKFYTSIWSNMRTAKDNENNMQHLGRKWVTNAKYDGFIGLFSSILLVTLIAICFYSDCFCKKITNPYVLTILFTSGLLLLIFIIEALKNYRYLVQDLLSSYATLHKNITKEEKLPEVKQKVISKSKGKIKYKKKIKD